MSDGRGACALVIDEGRVLVMRLGSDANKDSWGFPGGSCGQEDAEGFVRRTVNESLSLRLSTMWLLDSVHIKVDDTTSITSDCFVCVPVPGQESILLARDDVRWVNRDGLLDLAWDPASGAAARLLGMYWDQVFASTHL